MSFKYLFKRLLIFFLTIFIAATLNFMIPRLTPQDPIASVLGMMASKGVVVSDSSSIVDMYTEAVGLDQPVLIQYFKYLGNVFFRFDFGYSISYYPSKVLPII